MDNVYIQFTLELFRTNERDIRVSITITFILVVVAFSHVLIGVGSWKHYIGWKLEEHFLLEAGKDWTGKMSCLDNRIQ